MNAIKLLEVSLVETSKISSKKTKKVLTSKGVFGIISERFRQGAQTHEKSAKKNVEK